MKPPVLSRRERKVAETRLGLLDALLERLSRRSLDDISVRELCEAADLSEASFFNHFPTKTDLLVYFVELWSLEAGWHARQAEARGVRAAVEAVFALTAKQVMPNPRVMAEIIVFQARMTQEPARREITRAERLLRFPDLDGIESIEARGFDELLLPMLQRAIERGELPTTLEPHTALLAFSSVFFGVPLLLGGTMPSRIGEAYVQQLDVTWRGLLAFAQAAPSGAKP